MRLESFKNAKSSLPSRRLACALALTGVASLPLTPALAEPEPLNDPGDDTQSFLPKLNLSLTENVNPYIPCTIYVEGTGFYGVQLGQRVSVYAGLTEDTSKPEYFPETIDDTHLGFVHVPAERIEDGAFKTELVTGQLWYGQYRAGLEYAVKTMISYAESTEEGHRTSETTKYDTQTPITVLTESSRLDFDKNPSAAGGSITVRGTGFESRYIPAGARLRLFINRAGLGEPGQLAPDPVSLITVGPEKINNGAFEVNIPYVSGLDTTKKYTLGVQIMSKTGTLANDALTTAETFMFTA